MSEKTVFKCLGLCQSMGSNTAEVDVIDNKIVRTRPFRYGQSYSPEEYHPWTMEVKGKTFKASGRSEIPPLSVVYKKRYDSPNRIPYPLKRVDWDPNGDRHPETRGISKYERISWDEAATICANEIRRVIDTYGSHSILLQCDGHGETKSLQGAHSTMRRLADALGGFCIQSRNADSWEGWCWGAKHMWGQSPVGQGTQQNLLWDVANNSDTLLMWGGDYEVTPWGWGGMFPSRYSFFIRDVGVRHIFVCPDVNYSVAVHADKWFPVLPNTDAAMQVAIAYVWMTEGTFDRDYVDSHSVGFD